MKEVILKAEGISKQYRLGLVGTGTLKDDLNRWWHKIRGKEDPFLKIGQLNDRSVIGESDYVWALKDINFEVQKGEVLGIIGKNGAGKSTLLKILSRVTSPTTGEIKTRGRIASLLEVGTGFHGELTGRENIYLNGAILGMTKKEINLKIEDIIEFSGCKRYIDTPVKRYSSGMTVRLAFAVAAFLEPDILVIDEVLAVGDAEFQKKAIGKMQDISRGEGRTVLFVSHNMAAVRNLCTRGIVLENGIIVFEGNQNEAVDYYLQSSKNNNSNSLINRIDRTGNGKLKIKAVELLNNENKPIDSVISGDFLRVKIFIELFVQIKEKLIFGISILDSNEELKAMAVSDEMDVDLNQILDRGYCLVDINKLKLRGGRYSLKLLFAEGSTDKENQLDNISNAIELLVLPGDYYLVGKTNRSYNAFILECSIN